MKTINIARDGSDRIQFVCCDSTYRSIMGSLALEHKDASSYIDGFDYSRDDCFSLDEAWSTLAERNQPKVLCDIIVAHYDGGRR